MEVFQLKTNSWFLPRELFLPDPLLASQKPPVLCHILTGALAVPLPHRLSVVDYEQNLMRYLWRFRSGDGVLRVYNVTVKQAVRNEADLQVLCQHLCFRPEMVINRLPVQQQLYLIGAVIKITEVLAKTFSFFGISKEMVGLDKNGQVRMWINSNHADNKRQAELQNEEQQFKALLQLFEEFKIENRLVNAYLQNLKHMNIRFKHHEDYHQKFIRLHHLQVKQKINVARLLVEKSTVGILERDTESCPTSSLKLSTQTADITSTLKENSLNCKLLPSKAGQLYKSQDFPKYFNKSVKHRLISSKENRKKSLDKSPKTSLKSSFNNTNSLQCLAQSPAQFLATHAKLQQSFFVQQNAPKPTSNVPINLQLLGKMGKYCQSMTAEELILEEFKSIYH